MNVVEKSYYVERKDGIDRAMELLAKPMFALCVEHFPIEMNYEKVTVTCLENQVMGIEHILADLV